MQTKNVYETVVTLLIQTKNMYEIIVTLLIEGTMIHVVMGRQYAAQIRQLLHVPDNIVKGMHCSRMGVMQQVELP